jgi:phenylacetate-CoA ligase
MTNWINKLLFKLGARIRNPRLFYFFEVLISTDKSPKTTLNALQEKKLQELLIWANEHSAYYKKLFAELGFNPEEGMDWEKFQKIPPISKSDLIQNNAEIQVDPEKFTKVFYCESSGTSGQVLTFKRDEAWDSFIRAAQMRGYSWHGVNPWDFNIYFWGYNSSFFKKLKLRILDRLVNRFRIFDYDESSIKNLISRSSGVVYIEGYSSMIYEMAKLLPNSKSRFKKLKLVKGTSEKIYPQYKTLVNHAFGIPLRSEYGAAEAGIIAFECPEGNMHLVEEGVLVETDEENEIIITNLVSKSFPIIRYKLGDVVEMENEEFHCPCGRAHRIIKEITGRVGKVIEGKSTIFPSLTLYYIFKNIYFEHKTSIDYQAIQVKKGELEINTLYELSPIEKEWVLAQSFNYYKDDVTISFKVSSSFRMEKGKLKDFISKLN